MSAQVTDGAMGRDRYQSSSQAYEVQIQQTLEKVTDLVAFVQDEHFSLSTLHLYWRGEKRAQFTVQTIGRLLGRPLGEELVSIEELLERTLPYDLFEFSGTVTPHLFGIINKLAPTTGDLGDRRAEVEQLHYAADVRQAVLQHVLAVVNQRYQTPRFQDLSEASRWTEAYSSNLQAADNVIHKTRELLKQEVTAAERYLRQISRDIEMIEADAEARFGIVKRVRWASSLEEAEHEIHNILAERAAEMESVTFSVLTENQNSRFLDLVTRPLSKAPKIGGMLLLGLAGSGVVHATQQADLSDLPLPKLPEPIRGDADPTDTARFTGLEEQEVGNQSARYASKSVQDAVQNASFEESISDQATVAREKVDHFFDTLDDATGRQTLVIQNQEELSDLLTTLTDHGYEEAEILSLLGLDSVEEFSHPLTLDVRNGREKPILFPYNSATQATAPTRAIPQVRVVHPIAPGDSLQAVAEHFGVSQEAIERANPSLDGSNRDEYRMIAVPGDVLRRATDLSKQLQRGDSLTRVASFFDVPADELARLNDIDKPGEWQYEGGVLNLPAAAIAGLVGSADRTTTHDQVAASSETAAQPSVEIEASEQQTAPGPAVLAPSDSFIVYRVQPDETLQDIANRYGTSAAQIVADNALPSKQIDRGQNLLIRRPAEPSPTPSTEEQSHSMNGHNGNSQSQATAAAMAPRFTSGGSFGGTGTANVVGRYGDKLFPALEQMPSDARGYFVNTVQEVSDFFNVRPGDVMGILRSEQNNAGWRLQEDRVSRAGATGVAQIVPRTWNGWANPEHGKYTTNMLNIERHGGLGFDWSSREEWLKWKEGKIDGSALVDSNADPTVFENSVAAVARHLVHHGLTKDFAERDPEAFASRLADAIAVYNSGRTLDVSAEWVQSEDNSKTTREYVAQAMATAEQVSASVAQPTVSVTPREATSQYASNFQQLYDQSFGVALSDDENEYLLATNSELVEAVRSGTVEPENAAVQLLTQVEQRYIAEGREALRSGTERPWPYIHNKKTLYAQQSAVSLLGRTLTLYEIDDLMYRTKGERDAIRVELMSRADARLYTQAKHLYNQMLDRSERDMPVLTSEVREVVEPVIAGHSPSTMDDASLHELAAEIQKSIKSLDEYKQLHGTYRFTAMPLKPMPDVFRKFGVPVNYQIGGKHTGIDIANPRSRDGKEPAIYAVDDAVVAHVGTLYCDAAQACRGGNAIVLDHGNDVYTIYSHNSKATVEAGDRVEAGQMIGRQGNEGYSYGSHLHFEVHVGAPFTGNWEKPFDAGEFVDPIDWLPLPD